MTTCRPCMSRPSSSFSLQPPKTSSGEELPWTFLLQTPASSAAPGMVLCFCAVAGSGDAGKSYGINPPTEKDDTQVAIKPSRTILLCQPCTHVWLLQVPSWDPGEPTGTRTQEHTPGAALSHSSTWETSSHRTRMRHGHLLPQALTQRRSKGGKLLICLRLKQVP